MNYKNELDKNEFCNLYKIHEFENLDYKVLARIAELCEAYFNRGKDFHSITEIKDYAYTIELKHKYESLQKELLKYEEELNRFEDLFLDFLNSNSLEDIKNQIRSYKLKNFPLHQLKWNKE